MAHANLAKLVWTGYQPGVIGLVTALHAIYYARHWGFDRSFESQVARELSDFLCAFDPARDLFLAAWDGRDLAGAVALDGHSTPEQGARLRWFIVDKAWQGRGLGRELLRRLLEFARAAGHQHLHLWTFAGLDAARRLYGDCGFVLTQEHPVEQWGGRIVEQRLDLELTPQG
jgi:GNAT superfamily N-acetyltransferase